MNENKFWKAFFGKVIFHVDISFLTYEERRSLMRNFRRLADETEDILLFDGRYLTVIQTRKGQ